MTAPLIPLYTGVTPQRTQSQTDFANNGDDWLTYQSPLAADYNALAVYLDALAVDVDADALLASNSAVSAAASANFAGEWADLTGALNIPSTVRHQNIYWQLLTDLADVTASEPDVTSSDWAASDPRLVIPNVSGATLSVSQPNELQDGSTFIVPLANSVPVNWYIDVSLTSTFSLFTPLIIVSGSDLFEDVSGTDTSIGFVQPITIRLTSNGVDRWRL